MSPSALGGVWAVPVLRRNPMPSSHSVTAPRGACFGDAHIPIALRVGFLDLASAPVFVWLDGFGCALLVFWFDLAPEFPNPFPLRPHQRVLCRRGIQVLGCGVRALIPGHGMVPRSRSLRWRRPASCSCSPSGSGGGVHRAVPGRRPVRMLDCQVVFGMSGVWIDGPSLDVRASDGRSAWLKDLCRRLSPRPSTGGGSGLLFFR